MTHRIGFCTISALDRPLAEAARVAAAAGCDGIEVTARPPHFDATADPADAREAGRAIRAEGVDVVAFGSYLGHGRPLRRHDAVRAAEVAAAFETPLLRVWAPVEPDEDPAPLIEHLRTACDAAAPLGVTVVVERHIGSLADTPERVESLLADVDRPNFALNYQVLDFLQPEAASLQPADAARLAPRARYFHLKNYRPNPDGQGPLAPGGSLAGGVLDTRAIVNAALDAGYAGPMTIEFLAFDSRPVEEKLREDVTYLRGLLAEREPR